MSSAIQNIIEHSLGDGARSAKFEVQVYLPTNSSYTDDVAVSVLAKAAAFPGKSHEMIPIKFKGRSIPTRGQVRYTQSWDCTFYLTEDHSLKIAFEEWMEAIDQIHNYDSPGVLGASKLQQYFASPDTSYTMPIVIAQLNFDLDQPRAVYTLQNCFPVAINNVEVSSESIGALSEFTVTFALTHYVVNSVSANGTGDFQNQINGIISTAVSATTSFFGGIIGTATSGIQNLVSSSINKVTNEITGAASSVVDDLVDSLF